MNEGLTRNAVKRFSTDVERFSTDVERFSTDVEQELREHF